MSNAILLSSSVHVSDRLLGLEVIAPSFLEYECEEKSLMPTDLGK